MEQRNTALRQSSSGRDQLIALIESAASASASQLLVEEHLVDTALLSQPDELTFVMPKQWTPSTDISKLTLHVREHRVCVMDPLQRCAMPFGEYNITMWCGSVSWCVRRRFTDFCNLKAALEVDIEAIPTLKNEPLGNLLSINLSYRRWRAEALEQWLHAVCSSSKLALKVMHLASFLEIDKFHPSRAPRLLREARWGRRPPSPNDVTVMHHGFPASRRFTNLRRILCIHGWGTEPHVFRAETSRLRVALPQFEFVFLQAPVMRTPSAEESIPCIITNVLNQYDTHHSDAHSFLEPSSERKLQGPTTSGECQDANAERQNLESVKRMSELILELVSTSGPFDAVLGVAQGGAIVSLLSALQRGFAPPNPFGLPELPCLWTVRNFHWSHIV